MNSILIIGADSFIASMFYEQFHKVYKLRCISRKPSGKKDEKVLIDLFDIQDDDYEQIDIVINFAAIVHQPKLKDKHIYQRINTLLPLTIARTAKKNGVNRFIQMSTLSVYGQKEIIDLNSKEQPIDLYGESKLNADNGLLSLATDDFNISIARPPMVYGIGKAPGNMSRLINLAKSGIPLPFKKIDNQRDFIHVLNLVNAINCIIKYKINGIVIPTDTNPISTSEIMDIISEHSYRTIRLFYIPKIFRQFISLLTPNIYRKLFMSQRVYCSLDTDFYTPKYKPREGIIEMLNTIEDVK